MSKIIFDGVVSHDNGGDGILIVGENDISMRNVNSSSNNGHGINIINNNLLKENGLNLTLESTELQNLIRELRSNRPTDIHSYIMNSLAPFLSAGANIAAITSSIISIANI
ncbi:MAG: hypothetical protein RSA22_06705 [Acinetobacter sp.]